MRKEVLDHYWDNEGEEEKEYGKVDHDDKPVIGLKSALDFVNNMQ